MNHHSSPSTTASSSTASSEPDSLARCRAAAEQGDADAQFNLAEAFRTGRGEERSITRAVDWYRRAAEQGHARAQLALAHCCHLGKGTEQSDAEPACIAPPPSRESLKPSIVTLSAASTVSALNAR